MGRTAHENPFDVTKAVDLTDEQIRDTWVDLPRKSSLIDLAAPRSPMPTILIGGKGSGRTHLLRYFSYHVQLLRSGADALKHFTDLGYVGVFVQCELLGAGRFKGAGQSREAWSTLFRYYADLWLAQLAVATLSDLSSRSNCATDETRFLGDIKQVVDLDGLVPPRTIEAFRETLKEIQTSLDRLVNNAPLRRAPIDVHIRSTESRLIFEIPRLFLENTPSMRGLSLVYLFDEVENLEEEHQKYINTLVRHRRAPVSIKVGCRTHGLKTYETFSAGEQNRQGAEFELVEIDEHFRTTKAYPAFARRLVAKRLASASLLSDSAVSIDTMSATKLRALLDPCFESFDRPDDAEGLRAVVGRYPPGERPYQVTLRSKLDHASAGLIRRSLLRHKGEIDGILSALRCDTEPIVERVSVFMFYQDWYRGKANLHDAAVAIARSRDSFLRGPQGQTRHGRVLKHFRSDMLAQLLHDCRQPQRYVGVDTFIQMSAGIPRHLLVILKSVFRLAAFNGEQPFVSDRDGIHSVSLRSQMEAIERASNWFYQDARVVGKDLALISGVVDRVGGFFRALRFTDKPVEPSLMAFSYREDELSEDAREVLFAAENASLLLRVKGGHKNRNTRQVEQCVQINPMLAPRFDLPVGRRGVIELTRFEVTALLAPVSDRDFDRAVRTRVARMNAPFSDRDSADQRQEALHLGGDR